MAEANSAHAAWEPAPLGEKPWSVVRGLLRASLVPGLQRQASVLSVTAVSCEAGVVEVQVCGRGTLGGCFPPGEVGLCSLGVRKSRSHVGSPAQSC